MSDLKVNITDDEYRTVTTAILKLSRLLLINKSNMLLDDVILFNTYLEKIENINIKMNRELVRKIKRYQLNN